MRIHFVRHLPTVQDPSTPSRDWLLAPEITAHETMLTKRLRHIGFDALLTSKEPKSQNSAARLFPEELHYLADSRLNELSRAGFIKDYAGQVERVFARPEKPINNWEPAAVCFSRVLNLIEELLSKEYQEVGLVGHGLQAALVRAHTLSQSQARLEDWQQIQMPDYMHFSVSKEMRFELIEDFANFRTL
ncbi:MAG: histidine phosphatase family protein [Pseudomonadota bacterium]|nr:histidine phosphatase family protein [Pseudomonadota bacterium]